MTEGFQTAQGSFYRFDSDGLTQRLKTSAGEGHGKLHNKTVCVFLSVQGYQEFLHAYSRAAKDRVEIGWVETGKIKSDLTSMSEAEKRALFIPHPYGNTPMKIPPGCSAYFAIKGADGRFKNLQIPSMQPAVGLTPVELSVDLTTLQKFMHVGNKIVATFDDQKTALAALMGVVGKETFDKVAQTVQETLGPKRFEQEVRDTLDGATPRG